MSYIVLGLLALAAVGVVYRLWAAARAPRREVPPNEQPQVTSTDAQPPAHPEAPVPGSDAGRRQPPRS